MIAPGLADTLDAGEAAAITLAQRLQAEVISQAVAGESLKILCPFAV